MFNIICLVIIISQCVLAQARAEEPLQVMVTHLGKPYAYFGPLGQPEGLLIKILEQLIEPVGLTANYQVAAYRRSIHKLNQGDADIMLIARVQGESFALLDDAYISVVPIMTLPLVLYKLASKDVQISSWAEVYGYRLGMVLIQRERRSGSMDISYYARNEYLFKALAEEEIDLVLAIPHFQHDWESKFNVKVEPLGVVQYMRGHIAISSKRLGNQALPLCRRIVQSYRELSQEGGIGDVLAGLGLDDLVPSFSLLSEIKGSGKECVKVGSL